MNSSTASAATWSFCACAVAIASSSASISSTVFSITPSFAFFFLAASSAFFAASDSRDSLPSKTAWSRSSSLRMRSFCPVIARSCISIQSRVFSVRFSLAQSTKSCAMSLSVPWKSVSSLVGIPLIDSSMAAKSALCALSYLPKYVLTANNLDLLASLARVLVLMPAMLFMVAS